MAYRWFKLNANFDESEWLANLPPLPRLIWPLVLGHVKVHGFKGICKAPNLTRWCAGKDIPKDALDQLVEAAIADGAMVIENGEWVIPNWAEYQSVDETAYERIKRFREKKRQANACETDDNALSPNETGDNVQEKEKEKEKENKPPLSPKGGKNSQKTVSATDRAKAVYLHFEPHLRSKEVYDLLVGYFNQGKSKTKTEDGYKMLAKRLNKFKFCEVVDSLEVAISSEHQGIFPKSQKTPGPPTMPVSDFDRIEEMTS
jgi:hypothetical protein